MLQTDANFSVISKAKLTPQIDIKSSDVLVRSVDLYITKEYHEKFSAFFCICTTMFSPSFSVLRTTELAERLIYLQTNWNS